MAQHFVMSHLPSLLLSVQRIKATIYHCHVKFSSIFNIMCILIGQEMFTLFTFVCYMWFGAEVWAKTSDLKHEDIARRALLVHH